MTPVTICWCPADAEMIGVLETRIGSCDQRRHHSPGRLLPMAADSSNLKLERSLNKQIILDEDEYTAALADIITRDFFPSLVHLDATNDYLDAVHSRDSDSIAASVQRLHQVSNTPVSGPSTSRRAPVQTPGPTPYVSFPSDTPFHIDLEENVERVSKRPRYDTSLSLDEFQTRYTSEDNSSFTQILDQENTKRKENYTWAWEAQKRVEAQRERMIEARERMLIEPAGGVIPGVREKFRIEAPTPVGLITAAAEQKEKDEKIGKERELAVVVKATSVEEATKAVMAPRKDQRPAGVDGWKFKVKKTSILSSNVGETLIYEKDKELVDVFTRCGRFALPCATQSWEHF